MSPLCSCPLSVSINAALSPPHQHRTRDGIRVHKTKGMPVNYPIFLIFAMVSNFIKITWVTLREALVCQRRSFSDGHLHLPEFRLLSHFTGRPVQTMPMQARTVQVRHQFKFPALSQYRKWANSLNYGR